MTIPRNRRRGPVDLQIMNCNAIPLELVRALVQPIPVVATERGAVVITPAGCIELRQLTRGAWEWLGEDETRRPLVRAALA